MIKKLSLLALTTLMLFITITSTAQNQNANSVSQDSLHVKGNVIVDGYLISKHIKSPDGTVHIGDSSMTWTTLVNQNNPIKGVSTYTYESQSTSITTSGGMSLGWNNTAPALRAMAFGYEAAAYGDYSMAFGIAYNGTNFTETDADRSIAMGYAVKTASTATYAIAFGSGTSSAAMTHSVTNSLGVGFNSTIPTFFVGPGTGAGTLGNVGIGTTSPAQLLHVTGRARFDLSTAASTTGRMYVTRAAAANQECLLSFCTGGTSTYDWVAGTYNNGATGNSDWILNSWNSRAITAMYSNGNVAIGSTGTSNDVPLAKLHVGGDFMVGTDGTSASSAAYIKNSSGAYTTSLTPDYTWYKDSTTGIFHPTPGKIIAFTINGAEKMRIDASGNIDINATSKIYLNSNGDSNHGLGVYGTSNDTTKFASKAVNGPVLFGYGGGALATNTSGTKKIALLWDNNGYVHIGPTFTNSTHTTAALTVGGDIIGKSLYVTNNNWSDFVFDKNYNLMPLSEVEKFYTANHHLPDVPTEKEIQQNGDNVGQTDAILLQKVEELTLYMVQQQKQIDELKKLLADKK